MLALKLRAPEPESSAVATCDEYWICGVESCGSEWTFSIISPDEAIETFVYASEAEAESARAQMFRALYPAVSITAA